MTNDAWTDRDRYIHLDDGRTCQRYVGGRPAVLDLGAWVVPVDAWSSTLAPCARTIADDPTYHWCPPCLGVLAEALGIQADVVRLAVEADLREPSGGGC